MDKLEHVGFHECSVVQFGIDAGTLKLVLDGVCVNGNDARVVLSIFQVSSILVDGAGLDIASMASMMEAQDGEVLTLSISGNTLLLLVEWHDFANKKTFTKSYNISGVEISLSVM